MRTRCGRCKKLFDWQGRRAVCPRCRQPLDDLLVLEPFRTAEKVPTLSKKDRQRRAAARAQRQGAKAPSHKRSTRPVPTVGRLERVDGQWQLLGEAVAVVSDLPNHVLEGVHLPWDLGSGTATPRDCPHLRQLRAQWAQPRQQSFARRPEQPRIVGPQRPGSTRLERTHGLLDQVRRISYLAERKDDPVAWSEIASCWHVVSLRRALTAAMRDIGIDKILAQVRSVPEGWPDGLEPTLVGMLEEDRRRQRESGGLPMRSHSDYQLADL